MSRSVKLAVEFKSPDPETWKSPLEPRAADTCTFFSQGLQGLQVWVLKYAVWTKRDGYIPVYTVGMVNTRHIPAFAEYADPSAVSRLRVEPPRALPIPVRHAQALA